MYEYEAIVTNVVDGDTIDCEVKLGFHNTTKQRFRLLFIDAPETRGVEKPYGELSKEYLTRRIFGRKVILKSYKPKNELKTDSFGRWLAVVYVEEENKMIDINYEMIKLGYAVPYDK